MAVMTRYACLLITAFVLSVSLLATDPPCEGLSLIGSPTHQIRTYFPYAKPGSRGKAYVWWRNRTFAPDSEFDGALMTPDQVNRELIKIGQYVVGRKHAALPEDASGLKTDLTEVRKTLLNEHYQRHPQLLETSLEELQGFTQAANRAIDRYGSVEQMLKTLDINLELTPAKAARIRSAYDSTYGGKYIIDSEGNAFYLSEKEMETLKTELKLPEINHGAIGFLILTTLKKTKIRIIDYGTIKLKPGGNPPQRIEPYEHHWNGSGPPFDSLKFLVSNKPAT